VAVGGGGDFGCDSSRLPDSFFISNEVKQT